MAVVTAIVIVAGAAHLLGAPLGETLILGVITFFAAIAHLTDRGNRDRDG